ncbi:MAG TPA: cell division protein FtsL [Polyangiaceae bacterium]|nr:cell division protein FtsL [Polyangiaceae bacterium]
MTRSVKRSRTFLVMWTLAVLATASAFVVHLALRGRTVALGYEIGRSRAEQARLREVKRVLELESASYQTPERVEMVSRTLLGMEPPTPDRVVILAPIAQERQDDARERPSASGKTAQGDSRDSRDGRESPP